MKKAATYCLIRQVPYCCGLLEAGSFIEKEEVTEFEMNSPEYKLGNSIKKAWQKNLQDLRDIDASKSHKRPILFNFKKPNDEDAYKADTLRQLVMAEPDFHFIAEYTNPNTHNTIYSCVLLNGASK